ncbi:putative reverse transcriptase domain-containing protein [Tanacetum coccineum]
MLRATQPTTIQNAILRAEILTDEVVNCGTLTKGSDKRKGVEESSKTGGSRKDNKKAKVGTEFVATAPPRNETVRYYLRCSKCYTHHPENKSCRLCFNCQRPGHFAKDCRVPSRQVAPGRIPQDLKSVVTGTISLNDRHSYRDYNDSRGPDFSFITTEIMRPNKLNVETLYCESGYVIEVADCGERKKVEHVKKDEPKLGDIPIVRDFEDVFPEDLSGLPPQRQVEFLNRSCPGATPMAKSVIYTDHKSLQYIFDQKELNMCQRRWIELLVIMSVRLHYILERQMVVADALMLEGVAKTYTLRAMAMTVKAGKREKIQVAQSEALKQENIFMENLHGLDQQMDKKEV